MREDIEAQLRVALGEGLLSQEELAQLREEALRLGKGPLALLREKGRLSEGTWVSLVAQARAAVPRQDAEETASSHGAPPEPSAPGEPAFPVKGWDRYHGVRFLGEGGMGRVFLARDPRLHRDVALKFVRGDDPELARRFVSEARAQARVNHERVCQVYEVGEVEGRIYIAMQFIEGQPLSALAGQLTLEQKVLVLRGACEGVHEAHRAGLIHRDIKPSNIMVERTEDGTLKPYVMDFGLARDWNEGATASGTVLGTPHYMSPEQACGEVSGLDRRADVYSLGATLYAVLTGRPPIHGSNGLEVLNNIAHVEPRPPRALVPDLPADLEAISLKCLEKNRAARYDSARALAEELERFLSGEPVQARAPGAWYRLGKKLRKHRLVAAVVAVAALLVLTALGWGLVTRAEAAGRERMARRFTESVERIEALARYSGLSPLHDTRADLRAIRARMEALEAEIREAGAQAVGPGHYALGRGYHALGDEQRTLEHLESAWKSGFQEPRVAYALALATGRQYQAQLLEAERIMNPVLRETRKREVERRYREPVLDYLRRSEGAETPSTAYVQALIAFYEDRLDEALAHLDTVSSELSWFHEAPTLRGDILLARASRRWNHGEHDAALADFEAGRKAYAQAAAAGESVPAIHRALGELEYNALVMALYGQGDIQVPYARGLEAVSRALTALPEHPDSRLLEARFHRRMAEYRTDRGEDAEPLAKKAVDAAQRALELASSKSQARLELGRAYLQWGEYLQGRARNPEAPLREAQAHFDSIPPEDRDYLFHANLGLVFKTWADYQDGAGADSTHHRSRAIASYQEAIQLNARLPDAWINLGIAYHARASHPRAPERDKDLDRAHEALGKALELNPGHVVACFYAGEVHALTARRQRARGEDARPALTQAAEMYRKALALNAGIPQLHNGLGLVLIEQARESWDRGGEPFSWLEQAEAAFEQSVAVAPRDGLGYLNLGEVQTQRAEYQRARRENPSASVRAADAALQQALQRLPEHAGAWSNLGMSHAILASHELEQGREPERSLQRAEEALRQALARNPQHAQTWLYVGETRGVRARWRASRAQGRAEDFEAAAQAYQKALELAPERQEFRVAFGHFHRAWASWKEQAGEDPAPLLRRGLELVEPVLAARPGWPDALVLRGSLRMGLAGEKRDERRKAWEDFSQALSANPNLAPSWSGQERLLAEAR